MQILLFMVIQLATRQTSQASQTVVRFEQLCARSLQSPVAAVMLGPPRLVELNPEGYKIFYKGIDEQGSRRPIPPNANFILAAAQSNFLRGQLVSARGHIFTVGQIFGDSESYLELFEVRVGDDARIRQGMSRAVVRIPVQKTEIESLQALKVIAADRGQTKESIVGFLVGQSADTVKVIDDQGKIHTVWLSNVREISARFESPLSGEVKKLKITDFKIDREFNGGICSGFSATLNRYFALPKSWVTNIRKGE